jgi:antitoxin MazE
MSTKIQKWGNSLGVRISKTVLEQVDIHENDQVEITVKDDNILIMPSKKKRYDLKKLVAQITDENLHDEIMEEIPVGKEIW